MLFFETVIGDKINGDKMIASYFFGDKISGDKINSDKTYAIQLITTKLKLLKLITIYCQKTLFCLILI